MVVGGGELREVAHHPLRNLLPLGSVVQTQHTSTRGRRVEPRRPLSTLSISSQGLIFRTDVFLSNMLPWQGGTLRPAAPSTLTRQGKSHQGRINAHIPSRAGREGGREEGMAPGTVVDSGLSNLSQGPSLKTCCGWEGCENLCQFRVGQWRPPLSEFRRDGVACDCGISCRAHMKQTVLTGRVALLTVVGG